ncbi:NADH-quinone oxidoreductase subunit M [Desulfomonile tiedjei]|uniref:NADH dehydrogenase subunit M n=1 Tax=Desulfomonile tiedjei (strain ATCC 49306 / DSM 6799 / DCB-1) TaxID=706587 RepID=I4C795_DESTA|nr:NADH-quinone oxidoreductase subunit M [Desulfomonile tiedjei]AFM25436.1 NADH dehydrogenase subunit M [Desulfomonile tiedjei DSM 6799]
MENASFPLLSLITFIPLIGAILLLILNRESKTLLRWVALIFMLADFVVSIAALGWFDASSPNMQLVENRVWIADWGISYKLGIDGISLFLVLLTTLLGPIVVLASWEDIQTRVKEFLISLLILQVGMIGVFVSLDLFLFYVFWEVMLIPMYLLIGVWGNPARRLYAAIKFVLYTIVGSLLMLVAILALYFMAGQSTGTYTFDLLKLYDFAVPLKAQFWMFLAFFLAFAIKVPMFPFHTWLPDAHTEAPTVGSVVLAAVLLKMGTYGFIRFAIPLFPNAAADATWWICVLSVIGVIYGAWVAMVQVDVKRLVAFSSVSHLGFVMLGMFAFTSQGVEGSILQMINHGLSTGALFLIVGMIYERRHTRLIAEFGGLSKVMPLFAVFFMIFTLSSIGLPGLNGFVGEFLILLGTFKVYPVYAVLAASGVIFAAVYMLWMFQRVMFGKVTNPKNLGLPDLSAREVLVLVPILVFVVWIGVYPNTFLQPMAAPVKKFLSHVETKKTAVLNMEKAKKQTNVGQAEVAITSLPVENRR